MPAACIDLCILVNNQTLPTQEQLALWVETAARASQIKTCPEAPEVSIRIVDNDESQSLNQQYRGKDKPTNVLSFPTEFPEGVDIPFLGDLVICSPVVERESIEQNKELIAHWAHMVIHGTLHLMGYDHIDEKDANIMEPLETALLASLGYPCPYTET